MFNQAIKMFEAQLARDPAYIEPRFCLAASHIWMGEAFARTGNTAQALSSYQTGMAGWDPLALNDEGTSAQAVVAGLRIKISLLLAKMGKREPASEDAERGLKIAQSITAANPNILEAQYRSRRRLLRTCGFVSAASLGWQSTSAATDSVLE